MSSGQLAVLPAPGRHAVQHFDPRYHRTSVVDGLAGSGFSADEIGLIYAANWERDLSQAHPALGNAILEWKAVKVAAHEGRLAEADITAFHNACQHVLEVGITNPNELVNGLAYGGYNFYEHMDNPAGTNHGHKLATALDGLNISTLPDHIFASREYIKEMLFDAAKLNHPDLSGGYTATAAANSKRVREKLGPGSGTVVIGAMPSGAVADETACEVRRQGGGSGTGPAVDPESLDLIGRASHALEDFWSHSNFVELAIGDLEFKLGGLTTATFGTSSNYALEEQAKDDKTHALSHKIRGAADEIAAEMPLVDLIAGRSKTAPTPDQVHLGDETPPHHESLADDLGAAMDQARSIALAVPGAMVDGAKRGWERGAGKPMFGPLISAAEGAAVGGLGSVLGSRGGVLALRELSEYLDKSIEEKQEKTGDRQAHGLLAKDQPGHEDDAFGQLKTVKFEFAHTLSVAADRAVTAKMKAVINAADASEADARLTEIYLILDQLVDVPSASHPLADVIVAFRERGVAALEAYRKSQPQPPKPDYGPFLNGF